MFWKGLAALMITLPLMLASVNAQETASTTTMLCLTSDGYVVIDQDKILLRDYKLTFDRFISDGVIELSDPNAEISAVLDTRGVEGIYLEIREGSLSMQIVAPRNRIQMIDSEEAQPGSPAHSNAKLLREAVFSVAQR